VPLQGRGGRALPGRGPTVRRHPLNKPGGWLAVSAQPRLAHALTAPLTPAVVSSAGRIRCVRRVGLSTGLLDLVWESNPRQTSYWLVALPTELTKSGGMPGIEPGGRPILIPVPSLPARRHVRRRRPEPGTSRRRGSRTPTCERIAFHESSVARRTGTGLSATANASAGARPAIHARRRGCVGLPAGKPRTGSAHTAGTRAACPLVRASGRPSAHCMPRRR
jgi:hypothetical protein